MRSRTASVLPPHGERRRGSRARTATSLPSPATPLPEPREAEHPAALSAAWRRAIQWVYFALAIILAGYVATVLARPAGSNWPWLDSWGVAGFEAVASLCVVAHCVGRRLGRCAAMLLGCGLLSWAVGDFAVAVESIGAASAPTPSVADVFYLLFYPFTYAAVMVMAQRGLGRLSRTNWLDGVVAGLGAAALCATFAFHRLVHFTGGHALATAVNLAYPIGDLLLLALLIGGTVILNGRNTATWYLLALGVSVIVLGDTFNLFNEGGHVTRVGAEFDAIAWPVAIFLMSFAVWQTPRRLDPLRPERTTGFLLPGLASITSLVILVLATFHPVSRVALWLAIVTLLVVGLRLAISAHHLRILTEERHRQANTDELTGLGNRRHLAHVLDEFFGAQDEVGAPTRPLAFLFVDLNHFKEVNDRFGHPAGDDLLRQLGPRLTSAVGDSGAVVRLGGDELAIVLVDADAERAAEVAERIVAAIEVPFALGKIDTSVSASIGIALVPTDANDAPSAMWCADVAMYRAKLASKNFVFYDPELDGGESQIMLLHELTHVIDVGEFVLHYQPLMDLRSGDIVAAEALIRWPHPTLGLIAPDRFIPMAEEAGLMAPLTAWVIEEATAQCAAWRAGGLDIAVSVNVSSANLMDDGFVDQVAHALARHGLSGPSLVIEITETLALENIDLARRAIEDLHALGVVVSIDDFGAGATSLAYLSNLAVGELKLDRTFITRLAEEESTRDLELVRATIRLGHEMGLRVVAEGIENVATLDVLGAMGCDVAQGYYIARPGPPDQVSFARRPVGRPDAELIGS